MAVLPGASLRFVVIGGGIAGSFASYYLLKDGHDVLLVDPGHDGFLQTSVNNSGILSSAAAHTAISGKGVGISKRVKKWNGRWFALARDLDGDEYDTKVGRLVPRSVELYNDFLRGREDDVNLQTKDLTLYATSEETQMHHKKYGGRIVGSRELQEIGYAWPGSGVLGENLSAHTGKLLAILRERIRDLGVKSLKGTATLKRSGGSADFAITEARIEDHSPITADGYIVAAGSWSNSVCAPLGYNPRILPARGLAEYCDTAGTRVVDYPATFPELTVTQHDQYSVRLTGFFDLVGFDGRISRAKREWLFGTAASYLSRPNHMSLSGAGAGFRPSTPDQLPVVGPIPGSSNGYIASGGTRKGITLAPLMGRLIAKAVGGSRSRTDSDSLSILSPSRFGR